MSYIVNQKNKIRKKQLNKYKNIVIITKVQNLKVKEQEKYKQTQILKNG